MSKHALVVATGPVTEGTRRILRGIAQVVEVSGSEASLLDVAPDAVGFIVRADSQLSGKVIQAAPQLRVIGRSGIGVDNVDVEAATRCGIPIVVTPEAGVDAVAEGTFAMLLALAKQLPQLDALVRSGRWSDRDRVQVFDLNGASLGVVGMGRIGRRVASLGAAFGMGVLATDPFLDSHNFRNLGAEPVGLKDLFEMSDYISLHAPLEPDTQGLVTKELMLSAGPGAFLVNLARGGLIESLDALLSALESGALAGVGLDVFDLEPPDHSHPLFADPRVLLSPHALGMTVRSRERVFEEMSRGMVAVLDGRRPAAVANPEVYESDRER